MIIKEKLKNLAKKVSEHRVKFVVGLGLAGLVAVTSLKDNVHFGAVRLHNPQENHYAWGIWPTIGIEGKKDENVKGNFYSIGLFAGGNNVGENSTITGNMKAYGLIAGENNVGENSTITGNMKAYSLFAGKNFVGENSTITGKIDSKGLIAWGPSGIRIGSNVEIGLENYVVKKKVEKAK
jgi:hypothetical protein